MFALVLALGLALPMAAPVAAHDADEPFTTDLIAGGGNPKSAIDVGEVLVWNGGEELCVKYELSEEALAEGWFLTETHLAVATDPDDIPQKKGNPISGHFAYGDDDLGVYDEEGNLIGGPDSYQQCIPLSELGVEVGEEVSIAAHAVVQKLIGYDCPTLAEIAVALPDQVNIHTQNYPNADSYFDVEVSGGTGLDGTYGVWCIDEGHTIYINSNYTVNVYSSYEELPDSLTTGADPNIDHPENLDLVNWVMNNSDGYTSTEVQNVIWALLDDKSTRDDLTPHEQELYDAAIASGEGFVPGMGDVVGIILQPVDPNANAQVTVAQVTLAQVTLVEALGLECTPIYQSETAWGEGEDFPGKNWAMYIDYTVQE